MIGISDWARSYAARGLHPLRLHGLTADLACTCGKHPTGHRSSGKHPIHVGWQQSSLRLDQLCAELDAAPESNVGLRMGAQADGRFLVALDVDDPTQFDELLREIGPLPTTFTTHSGRGRGHLLFYIPSAEAGALRNWTRRRGLDLRAEGGQVAAPPSRHYTGTTYTHGGAETPAMLPAAWLQWLLTNAPKPTTAPRAAAARTVDPSTVPAASTLEEMAARLAAAWPPPGCRYEARFALPGMLARGTWPDDVIAAFCADVTVRAGGDGEEARQQAYRSCEAYADGENTFGAPTLTRYLVGEAFRTIETVDLLRLAANTDRPVPAAPSEMGDLGAAPPPGWDLMNGSLAGAPRDVERALKKYRAEARRPDAQPELENSRAVIKWLTVDRGWNAAAVTAAFNVDAGRFALKLVARAAPAHVDASRPTLSVYDPQHEVNRTAGGHLVALDTIFGRGGELVEVRGGDITRLSTGVVRDRLSRAVNFVEPKTDRDTGMSTEVCVGPPDWCVQALASEVHLAGTRPLNGTLTVPTLRADGSVSVEQGYDAATGLYLLERFEPVQMSVDEATAALAEPFRDFAFDEGTVGPAVAIAAVLTLIARPLLWQSEHAVPGFAIDAGDGGRGKSLLCDVITLIGVGDVVAGVAWTDDEAELMKRIDAKLFAGARVLKFENVRTGGGFGTPALDGYLTAGKFVESRTLGSSDVRRVPWLATAILNGNNISFKGEGARRFMRARLGSKTEAFERTEDELKAAVRADRTRLQTAALTLLSAHLQARTAVTGRSLPSFAGWAGLVAGCVLRHFGVDPIVCQDGMADLVEGGDAVQDALEALEPAMREPKEVKALCCDHGLTARLDSLVRAWQPNRRVDDLKVSVGYAFRALKDRGGRYSLRYQLLDRDRRGWFIQKN